MSKVLLVEDHPEIRHILRLQFEWGFNVIIAKDGGVDSYGREPDLILMNSIIPQMDG